MTKFVDQYLLTNEKCKKLYGEKTFLFMQKGNFYEILDYASPKDSEIMKVSMNILGIAISNPNQEHYLAGVPVDKVMKYHRILLNHLYTVVVVDQQEINNIICRDDISYVLSPSLHLKLLDSDEKSEENNNQSLLGILLEDHEFNRQCTNLYIVLYEPSIGKISIEEHCIFDQTCFFSQLYTLLKKVHIFKKIIKNK